MPTARSAWRAHVGAHAALGAVASAPRHGFHAPNPSPDELPPERDGVLTWPEGNGWLAGWRMAEPLGERLHAGRNAPRAVVGRQSAAGRRALVALLAWLPIEWML